VRAGTGAAFAEAIASLFEGGRDERARAARQRAEASDWQTVLPGLLGHYLRLVGERTVVPASAAASATVGVLPR
jgi:hypothetical protein